MSKKMNTTLAVIIGLLVVVGVSLPVSVISTLDVHFFYIGLYGLALIVLVTASKKDLPATPMKLVGVAVALRVWTMLGLFDCGPDPRDCTGTTNIIWCIRLEYILVASATAMVLYGLIKPAKANAKLSKK